MNNLFKKLSKKILKKGKTYSKSKINNVVINSQNFKDKYLTWPPKIRIKDNIQKFAGGMMVTVVFLVIVGFFVGIGTGFSELTDKGSFWNGVWESFTNIGFKVMSFLPLWFCLGLAFSIAKAEKGWAAIISLFVFFAVNGLIGLYGSKTFMNDIPESMSGQVLWKKFAGLTTYNTGIFLGLIIGVWTSFVHNRSYKKELPMIFSFFGGSRWAAIKMAFYVIPFAFAFYFIWPPVGNAIESIGRGIGSLGLGGSFLFGSLDKTLLPLGLHHLIAFPIEYTNVGGTINVAGIPLDSLGGWKDLGDSYHVLVNGVQTTTVAVDGVRNIINMQASSLSASGYIVHNFTSGRLLFQMGGYGGIALALILSAKKENRTQVTSITIPAALTAAFVGITEPIEYTFLFTAPLLYFLIHVPLSGLAYVLAEVTDVSINGHALFFMIPNLAQIDKVHAMSLLYLIPSYFVIYFLSFFYGIKLVNANTPGRGNSKEDIRLFSKKDYKQKKEINKNLKNANVLEKGIIKAFGGKTNIISIENCATRLRVSVKDPQKVQEREFWIKNLDASGVVHNKTGAYQIIYGPKVINIATKVREILKIE